MCTSRRLDHPKWLAFSVHQKAPERAFQVDLSGYYDVVFNKENCLLLGRREPTSYKAIHVESEKAESCLCYATLVNPRIESQHFGHEDQVRKWYKCLWRSMKSQDTFKQLGEKRNGTLHNNWWWQPVSEASVGVAWRWWLELNHCLQSAVAHPQRWKRRCIDSSGTPAALQFPNSVTLNGE